MIQITYHMAMIIFQMYSDRFEGMDKVSDLKNQCEILLPHGVKLTKNNRRYYIKYYSSHYADWNMFCIDFGLEIASLVDNHEVPDWRESVGVKTNPDGSASFTGKLVGMGL